MRRAFTLIEIMVATMLLAMLVTILTMIFNQSSIAWSTGVASVTALGDTRQEMSVYARESENVILNDRGDDRLVVRSVWDVWNPLERKWEPPSDNEGNYRPLQTWPKFKVMMSGVISENFFETGGLQDAPSGSYFSDGFTVNGGSSAGRGTFLVGVHSYGPDGKTGGDNSWDDISTMPEEIVK